MKYHRLGLLGSFDIARVETRLFAQVLERLWQKSYVAGAVKEALMGIAGNSRREKTLSLI